jgi:hypothetical protein
VDHKEGIRCCSSHGFNYQILQVLPRGRLDRDIKAIEITKNRKKSNEKWSLFRIQFLWSLHWGSLQTIAEIENAETREHAHFLFLLYTINEFNTSFRTQGCGKTKKKNKKEVIRFKLIEIL